MTYQNIRTETRGPVGILTLHRPDALNALNQALMEELADALGRFDADDAIGAMVLTGSDKAFAAGADIKEMQDRGFADWFLNDSFEGWHRAAGTHKPIVAAVAGYALGGGCELAMMCDFIIAADSARFGQPEIKLGVLPGLGGTQRLTGRMMDAEEAERSGLVSRVVPAERLLDEAIAAATAIAGMSRPAVRMVRECINRSYETTLAEGLRYEQRVFYAAFSLDDQKEGMKAFVEKRKPEWSNR